MTIAPRDPTLRLLLAESIKPYDLEDLALPENDIVGTAARKLAAKVIADAFSEKNYYKWRPQLPGIAGYDEMLEDLHKAKEKRMAQENQTPRNLSDIERAYVQGYTQALRDAREGTLPSAMADAPDPITKAKRYAEFVVK